MKIVSCCCCCCGGGKTISSGCSICSVEASAGGGLLLLLLWHLFICSCKDFLCLYLDSQIVQANSEIPR